MKPSRELALDALFQVFGQGVFSREFFPRMLEDVQGMGRLLKQLTEAIEKTIDADRRIQAKAKDPS